MEENKFEKQVQQKMDELRIHPSDSVWEKIEARIEKKKRPNRGLIFFILLFCLLFTGGYFLWDINRHSNKKDNNKEANNFIKNNNKDTGNSEKATREISAKEIGTEKPEANFVTPSISQTAREVDNTAEKKNVNGNSLRRYKASTARKINSKINSANQGTITSSSPKETTKDAPENIQSTQGTAQNGETPSPVEKIDGAPAAPAYKKDSAALLPKPIVKEEVAKRKDSAEQKQKTASVLHPKKNTWKFGILFSPGISSIGNTFPGLNNSSAYLNDPASGSVTGGVPGPLTPSRIKPGFGFTAGVVAEKKVSAKIKLVTGINYASFNTTNNVGERNDTTGYYNYNSQNTINTSRVYKNYYHFIELPVAIKVQFGTGKNISVFWQGGFVVSQLINTNALQFNQSLGYYYPENSIFNKTQIGVSTSLSVALFSKQKNSVLIGPYFYYGASRLADEGLYNKKHFIFPGLRTEIIFGK